MASIRLTELHVKNAKPSSAGAQVDIWDSLIPGLSLRVTSKGTKTFNVKCRNSSGKEQRVKLGRYPELSLADARLAAQEAKIRIAKGELPGSARERAHGRVTTLEELVREFIKRHASKNRTAGETERLLRRELLPFYGSRDYKTITKSEIIGIIEELIDSGKPVLARNTLAAIRKMFNWAVGRDMLESSPCAGMSVPARPQPRTRVLDDHELARVYRASSGYPFGIIVKLLILTGQRRGEIAALKWEYVDDKRKTITLPAALTKNNRPHTFPYSAKVATLLEQAPHLGDYIFPARGNPDNFFSGWSKCKRVLDQDSNLQAWTLHDLRRTFATKLAALGTPIHVTEKLLNHVSGTTGGIVGVYQRHSYLDEMREAIDQWEKEIARIIGSDSTQQ